MDASFILDFKLKITIAVAIRSECKLSGCSLFINFYSLSYSDTDSVILSSKITFYFKLLRPAISKNQQFNIWDFRKSLQNHIIIVPLLPQPRKWTFQDISSILMLKNARTWVWCHRPGLSLKTRDDRHLDWIWEYELLRWLAESDTSSGCLISLNILLTFH